MTLVPVESEALMDFGDAEPKSVPVKIAKQDYVLDECSGGDAVAFRNREIASRIYNNEGMLCGLKDVASLEPYLVSLCLRKLENGERVPVSEATIKAWPAIVCSRLYKKARLISNLADRSTIREELEKALALPGSPVTIQAIRDWVNKQNKKIFESIQDWLIPSQEEQAKNS